MIMACCEENTRLPLNLRKSPGPGIRGSISGMAWLILVVAALFETGWAIGLKYSDGFTRPWPSLWTAAALMVSVGLLAVAARSLPIGTAYAVWTGIGAAGTALLGIWLFGDAATPARLLCIGLIIAGVVGLRVAG
jgi:quaternary ammonium compound-resistance protein SugE